MRMKDHGACVFFQNLHLHLFYLLSLSGDLTPEDQAEIAADPMQLNRQKVVNLCIDLTETGMRLSSPSFGGLGKMNLTIHYRGIIDNYIKLRMLPDRIAPAASRDAASRGSELLINAVERKAPGIFKTLVSTGLPKGFSFERWPQNENSTIPGQILRILPSEDLEEIVSWMQRPDFQETCRQLIAEINARHEGLETLN